MANKKNNEELKQQALRSIAQGRAEISAEVRHIRKQLSPARLMHRMVDRRPGRAVILALVAGILPALFLFRGKRPPPPARSSLKLQEITIPPKPLLGAVLLAALGVMGKSIALNLIKSSILPRVLDSIAGKMPATIRTLPSAPSRPGRENPAE